MRISDWSSDVCSSDLAFIDGATQHVHDASQCAFADRYRNGSARVGHFHATAQAVGGTHGNGTHHAVAQLLLDFESKTGFGKTRAGVDELERVVTFWDAVAGELNIHHGADALRSEERREGKECVSTCRSRGARAL